MRDIKQNKRSKAAFTLVEIIMVIIVLGIVSMIGTNIIAHMYENYMRSKYINELEQKTELALEIITHRLQYRVKSSAIVREKGTNNTQWLNSEDLNASYDMLEWIGYEYESFRGENNGTMTIPGWSGFVDLNNSETNATQIVTSGSNLDFSVKMIKMLSYDKVDLNNSAGKNLPAIIFKQLSSNDISGFGWDWSSNDHNYTLRVKKDPVRNDVLIFDENISSLGVTELKEQYYLAWSAYALVPEGNENDFNLTLYYNYQPWYNEHYNMTNKNIKRALVAEHVTSFKFLQSGNTVRVKLCIGDGNQTGSSFGFCKEKAVF